MKKATIKEVELNFCNACSANCFICSKAHGSGNTPLMYESVFEAVLLQLQDIEFETIQTSGNGDCWLHPQFLDWLRCLRTSFPKATIHNFNSFAMYDPGRIEVVAHEHLIDHHHTRLDTLDPLVFMRSTGINLKQVLTNIAHLLACGNARTTLTIGYSSIPAYYHKCHTILGKPPFHGPFAPAEVDAMDDELEAMQRHFGHLHCNLARLTVTRINQSLWAEREDPATPADLDGTCPKLKLFNDVMWICPNGDVNLCGYDDEQCNLTIGNVLNQHIADIWHSAKRQQLLDLVANRQITHRICNPRCCQMYQD